MKMMIIVRKDLNMRKGKMIAQGAHAVAEQIMKGMSHPKSQAALTSWWLDHGQKKVAVSVDSEAELLEIYQKAISKGINSSLIIDSGKTEFGGVATRTAVAIGPAEESVLDEITGHLKLL